MKKAVQLGVLAAMIAAAQSTAGSGGVQSEWDLKTLLQALTTGTQKLAPILSQVDPMKWPDAQAGQAYAQPWKSASNEINYLNTTAAQFAKQPERLTLALETFFRLQALQNSVSSLAEGIRKYQNPAIADLLNSVLVENQNNRERLKSYITELAHTKEQEFKIMDQEAQRCRGVLSRQTPAPPSRRKD